jgi:hypothetical protein
VPVSRNLSCRFGDPEIGKEALPVFLDLLIAPIPFLDSPPRFLPRLRNKAKRPAKVQTSSSLFLISTQRFGRPLGYFGGYGCAGFQ